MKTVEKSRGVLIAGNWKMNHTAEETRAFFQNLLPLWKKLPNDSLAVSIFPPYLSLSSCLGLASGTPIQIGAQNAHWEKSGAYTGEISGPMLLEAGIRQVLVGHSERRQFFGETDETVRKKTESLLQQGFSIILCIGETLRERESNQTEAVLTRQLQAVFPSASSPAAVGLDGRIVIAYEPVWAIGTGLTATPDQAETAHAFIRNWLEKNISVAAANRTQVLYGGSVKPDNIRELLACPNIDGALVGGASLKPADFMALVDAGGIRKT